MEWVNQIKPISRSFCAKHHDKIKKCYVNNIPSKKIILAKNQIVKHI